VPILGLVNVSVQEAGIIFSAAERAAARRRRPISEFSPGRSVLRQAGDQNSPSRVGLKHHAMPNRPSHLANQPSTNSASSSSSSTVEPLPASIETGLEELASIEDNTPSSSVRSSPLQMAMPSPKSPKRLVPNQILKAYADDLFLFTQSCLNNTITPSQMHVDASLLVPQTKVTEPTIVIPDLEISESPENRYTFRPPLKSRFSDWTTTDTDSIAEFSDPGSLHFDSSRNSGFCTPDMEASGLMSSDSFFAEVTPKVNQSVRWINTPNETSRASSPTRGCWSAQVASSVASSRPSTRSASINAEEEFSYFAGLDGASATVEGQAHCWPMDSPFEILKGAYTPSTQSARSSHLSLKVLSSSPSDTTPFFASQADGVNSIPLNAAASTQQMMEVEAGPPSWLVSAIY